MIRDNNINICTTQESLVLTLLIAQEVLTDRKVISKRAFRIGEQFIIMGTLVMVMRTNSKETGKIKSSALTFKIVNEIRKRGESGVTELADHFDHSKSTIHEHLRTLEEEGYVTNLDGRYGVGLRFLELGGYARAQQLIYKNAKKEIDELAEETSESAKLVVEENGRGVYLYQEYGPRAVITDSHVGTRVYLHSTATGKAILANLPEERLTEILMNHGLPEITENTVTDTETLRERLKQIRERGVAFDDEERIEGIRCVAAPICVENEILGAVSVSGPKKRLTEEMFRNELPEIVKNTTRVIEINCTYTH